jgi:hypothetical protein
MLEINLSTRPFYNERAVHLALVVLAAAVLAVTVANGRRLAALSAQEAALARRLAADTAAQSALDRQTDALERSVDPHTLEAVAAAARQANDLIARRTFSWTEFFNLIEATLPPDVMLTSVRPQFAEGAVQVSMTVVGKGTAELGRFMDQLESTGAFVEVLVRQEEVTDRGLHRAVVNARYLGASASARPASPRTSGEASRVGS